MDSDRPTSPQTKSQAKPANNWRQTLANLVRSLGWGSAVNGALLLGAALGVGYIQNQAIANATKVDPNAEAIQSQTQARLDLLKAIPTGGFDNLVANWAYLDYLQYFGDEDTRNATGYSLNDDYFDVMVERDPRFLAIYPFLSAGVSFYMGRPETAIALMEKGAESLSPEDQPESFWIWRHMALDRLLLTGDIPGTIQNFERAASWAEGTPGQESYGPFFRDTANFLRQNPDSTAVQIYGWQTVFYDAIDEPIRQRAEQELAKLGLRKVVNEQGRASFVQE
ncbi:MAG: hypothetical protein AAF889_11495 [Cyanobacteria bacterium P01_D01_bin.73]